MRLQLRLWWVHVWTWCTLTTARPRAYFLAWWLHVGLHMTSLPERRRKDVWNYIRQHIHENTEEIRQRTDEIRTRIRERESS